MQPMFESFVEVDSDGYVVLRFGFIATLYFRNGHSMDKRKAIIECFKEYNDLCGEYLRWCVVDGERFSPVTPLTSRDISYYLLSPKLEQSDMAWAFFWHGGEREEDASEFRIFGLGQPKSDNDISDSLSFLTVTFSQKWTLKKPEVLSELMLRWSDRLQPFHGYAGIGIVVAADDGLAADNENRVYAISKRCPGVEVDYPMDHCLYTTEKIKGGSWITVLSQFFIDQLGGTISLKQDLGEPFRVQEYQGGAIIIAGTHPEIGDSNRGIDTPNYRRLGRVLKPIRIVSHSSVGESIEDWFSADEFEAWLRRFDD